MSTATPGPWIYDIHDGSFYIFTASDMDMVADGDPDDVGIARMRGVGRGADSAEQEANALLISQAPAMLEHLKDAHSVLSRHVERAAGGILLRLERMIAKAEGAK